MSLLAFALLITANLTGATPSGDHRAIAEAVARQCADQRCVADALVWAWRESGLQLHPRPISADAIDGRSVGAWQTPAELTPSWVDGMLRVWLNMRRQSLFACGDLTALASGQCVVATGLVEARQREAEWWLLVANGVGW